MSSVTTPKPLHTSAAGEGRKSKQQAAFCWSSGGWRSWSWASGGTRGAGLLVSFLVPVSSCWVKDSKGRVCFFPLSPADSGSVQRLRMRSSPKALQPLCFECDPSMAFPAPAGSAPGDAQQHDCIWRCSSRAGQLNYPSSGTEGTLFCAGGRCEEGALCSDPGSC